ncbi:hypothetical protein M2322_001421 [Rhodoblastus acidophilus]|uniref:hypothetical protein n=1 Tax=Rhodoblastus acidophilus TaxID=1074 RepID=UPI002224EB52|nr:hypothetical protein [Rhodoblastus acidophilus]MCW2315877.1 hypothetical protein [Rhodoblastus acidophilus]
MRIVGVIGFGLLSGVALATGFSQAAEPPRPFYPQPYPGYQPQIPPPPPPPRIEIPRAPAPSRPTPPPVISPSLGGRGGGGGGGGILPGGMTMTAIKLLHEDRDRDAAPSKAAIDRPRQAADQLAACWSPPPPPPGETVEITMRFSFNRHGGIVGSPRITYVKAPGADPEAVRESLRAAIKTCSPLRFSKSMAASAPGYPISIRFIGRRAERD